MADAKRDNNSVVTLIGVSSVDGITPVPIYVDPTTHRMLVNITGSATPGGANTQVQYNNAGALGGITGATSNGTTLTLVAPVLGAATATSINGLVISTTTGTFALTNAKTLTVSNTMTLTATDTATVAFGAGGTVAYVGNKLSVFAATTSAELAGVISDETGSGLLVFATSPTLVTPVLGAATATSINGLTISTTTGTLTITNAKTLSVTNSITLSGTDSTVMTFPTTSATIARTDAANSFTGVQTFNSTLEIGNATDTTLSRSAAGVLAVEGIVIPSISSTNTLTNKRITKRVTSTAGPGATPTINTDNCDAVHLTALATAITSMTTNLTGTPVEGDTLRIDFTDNGTARGITWGTSFEASTVALPTTTVISTRLDVGFVWNTVTSKWRCVAVA